MRPGNSDFIILRIPVKTHEIFNQSGFGLPCPLYVNYSMLYSVHCTVEYYGFLPYSCCIKHLIYNHLIYNHLIYNHLIYNSPLFTTLVNFEIFGCIYYSKPCSFYKSIDYVVKKIPKMGYTIEFITQSIL